MKQQFYARGKLLLTSEFMILHGAKALAVPLTVGQSLGLVRKKELGVLHWIAEYDGKSWFETRLSLEELEIKENSSREKSENLVHMLRKLLEIKPGFMEQLHTNDVVTRLEFDPGFGFGSSSTLTALLSQWAEIDPMQLHFSVSRGSGYDVACASAWSAILYQVINEMPVVQSVDFQPAFMENMWLVYLGQKQESAKSVAAFLNNYTPDQNDISFYSSLTCEFLKANTVDEFGALIVKHEERLSEILQMPVLKTSRFQELDGYVKSLGAWGGDFALLVTRWNKEKLSSYLLEKGIDKWFAYHELIL
ncbi:MAG: GYDIA family GHMP kinase [Bacteroidales bacterium]